MVVIVPPAIPAGFVSMYLPAIYAGLIIGFIGALAIALNRREIHILILTDIIGLAMIFIVASVGTDLAEALILPGLVVELAETLAISEILISREMHKLEKSKIIENEKETCSDSFTRSCLFGCFC